MAKKHRPLRKRVDKCLSETANSESVTVDTPSDLSENDLKQVLLNQELSIDRSKWNRHTTDLLVRAL